LVSAQVAVTFILLMGTGLMFASLHNVLSIDPGFEPEGILATAVTLTSERYPDGVSRIRFIDSALEEIRSAPGVHAAGITSNLPFSGMGSSNPITPEGYVRDAEESVLTSFHTVVSPGYFELMDIPLVNGRDFRAGDTLDATPVVIIDEWMAERYWRGEDPIGKRLIVGAEPVEENPWLTIVGVVGSVKMNNYLETEQTGAFYQPHTQLGLSFFRFAVKTRSEPLSAMPEVREAIQRVDSELFPYWVVSLEATMSDSLIPRRVPMQLLMLFAGLALLLSALGIYGVLAYSVQQRSREIGIRMAFGGTTERIMVLVGKQWVVMVGLGLLIGLAGAWAFTKLIVSLLYEVTPTDPVVFAAVLAILGAIALVACLLPAWRATRVNAIQVLNTE
jgi:predicted permease